MTGSPSGIVIASCRGCGAGYFPPRLICPRCGARDWTEILVIGGVVEEVTTVRRAVGDAAREPTVLASVRLDDGPRIIAGIPGSLAPGDRVTLSSEGQAVLARPERGPP